MSIPQNSYLQTYSLQVPKCRTILVERTYTSGFIIDASQTEGVGPFTPTLSISYPSAPNATVSIVEVRTIGSDVCVRDVILDANGAVTISDYTVSDTHMIYAILKSVIITGTTIQCCTAPIDYVNCPTSNSILFTVTDIGSISILSVPSGAQIWLASTGQSPTDTGLITPNTVSNLPIGDYDYILKLTDFNSYLSPQPVTVIKDQTAIIGPIDLIPAEGCIYFKTSPSNAKIFLSPIGQTLVDTGITTPNIICGKSLGDYSYKLTLTGYEDATGTVTLVSGHGEIATKTLRGLPILSDIIISPLNPTVNIGDTISFSAVPIDQYNQPFPATVTWNSSNIYVGTIDVNTGVFSASHEGVTIITATSGTITKSTTATVTTIARVLTTIDISPSSATISIGNTQQFIATCKDQFNNTMTCPMIWSTTDEIIGTINSSGLFTGITQGTVTVKAMSGTIIGTAVVNVGIAPPVGGIVGDIAAGLGALGKNMIWAASVLGIAMIGAVISYKGYKEKEIEKESELKKIGIEKELELARMKEREEREERIWLTKAIGRK